MNKLRFSKPKTNYLLILIAAICLQMFFLSLSWADGVKDRPSFIKSEDIKQASMADQVIEAEACINNFLDAISEKEKIDRFKLVKIAVNMPVIKCEKVLHEYYK